MKISGPFCKAFAALLMMPSAIAFAQDLSLADAMSGKIPLNLKPTDLPDDFKAVKIAAPSTTPMAEFFSGISFLALGAAGNMTNLPLNTKILADVLPLCWTKGDVVRVLGQDYVVTYDYEPPAGELKSLASGNKVASFTLKLKLIKTTDFASITPMPEWTKERYLRAVGSLLTTTAAKVPGTTGGTRVAMNTKPKPAPIESIPTPIVTTPPVAIVPQTQQPAVVSPDINTPVSSPKTAVKGVATERPVQPAVREAALDNARNIASGMLLYSQDYDEVFPYVQSSKGAAYVIYPYVKNINVFKTNNPMRSGDFHFNMSLSGVPISEIANPTEVPLFYDPFAWPDGTYLVTFADSRAKFITAEEWDRVKVNLKLKLKQVGKPLPLTYGLPSKETPPPSGSGGG